jgi:acyl-coenzyme A synthetase/AMP-(fatty) acid ligase
MGYFNNAEETQKSFRQDGFVVTGDIGRMTADGFVVIIDRIKDLIKVGSPLACLLACLPGKRNIWTDVGSYSSQVKGVGIAPAELEDAVMRHHAVQDVGVSGIRDARAGEAPRAYVVLKRGISPSDAAGLSILDLVHKVKSRDKWLRGGIAFVASVPKSESGKILRRMLESVPVLLHVPYSSASSASL